MSVRQGNNIIAGLGGVEIDNKSITKNSIDQLQSSGSINKNSDSLHEVVYDWVGTAEEWEEQQIGTLHPDWVWYITDDATAGETVKTDDISIDFNGSGELEALGTLNKNSSSSTNVIYDWMGTLEEYEEQDVKTEHPDWVCYITDDEGKVNCARNVGDIFYTMRTDSLPGAVECNGATYNINDFAGDESIGKLLKSGKIPFISLSQYANDLSEHGSVRAFGWDGGLSTAFRVPTLNNVFLEAGQAASAGEYISAGLPNITGNTHYIGACYNNGNIANYVDGVFSGFDYGNGGYAGGGGYGNAAGRLSFDASRSSSIYGSSNTVQPNAVKYRAMVQLANANTDEALETCTEVLTDVADLKDHRVIDFQEPSADNNYTWYRLYADGWVEQGGYVANSGNENLTITLPIEMQDSHYDWKIGVSFNNSSENATYYQFSIWNQTATSFVVRRAGNIPKSWQVSGMSA